jgi:hypothetical protein
MVLDFKLVTFGNQNLLFFNRIIMKLDDSSAFYTDHVIMMIAISQLKY